MAHTWCDCELDVELHCHCLPTAAHTLGVDWANALEGVAEAADRAVAIQEEDPNEGVSLITLDVAIADLREIERAWAELVRNHV